MTLYDRDAYNFYMVQAKSNFCYRVFPMDVSHFAHVHELETSILYLS